MADDKCGSAQCRPGTASTVPWYSMLLSISAVKTLQSCCDYEFKDCRCILSNHHPARVKQLKWVARICKETRTNVVLPRHL